METWEQAAWSTLRTGDQSVEINQAQRKTPSGVVWSGRLGRGTPASGRQMRRVWSRSRTSRQVRGEAGRQAHKPFLQGGSESCSPGAGGGGAGAGLGLLSVTNRRDCPAASLEEELQVVESRRSAQQAGGLKKWPRSLPCGSEGKESACNAGETGSIPGSGRSPREGHENPLMFWPGECPGQRSLAGYSPWGRKELDTTEQLTRKHCLEQ